MDQSSKRLLNGCYQKIQILGQGSYGTVFLYRKVNDRKKSILSDFFFTPKKSQSPIEYFALKKYHPQFMRDKEGIDFSALRQINLLNSINHKNIANCYEIIHVKSSKGVQSTHDVYAVLDFYLQLTQLLTIPTIVKNDDDKKLIVYEILQGLHFLHKNYIFHRDLKPENIFISRNGEIKISDFGFAKQFGSPHGKYTFNTCTKQYRAPQLFFKTHYYTEKCDIWSFGCIVAYIFKNKTLFYSESQTDMQVLGRIFRLRGTPNKTNWTACDKFPQFLRFEQTPQKDLQKQLQLAPDVAKLISDCLQLNPSQRPSAQQLLKHEFFNGVESGNLQLREYYDSKLNEKIKKNIKSSIHDSWEQIQV